MKNIDKVTVCIYHSLYRDDMKKMLFGGQTKVPNLYK